MRAREEGDDGGLVSRRRDVCVYPGSRCGLRRHKRASPHTPCLIAGLEGRGEEEEGGQQGDALYLFGE